MKCQKCDSEIPDDVKYCPNCGYHFPVVQKQKPEMKQEKKWGWGWYILAGFIFTSINKYYKNLNELTFVLEIIGIAIALSLYFYFRNKILKEISNIRLRSFLAGIISYILSAITVALVANFITPNINSTITNSISIHTDELKSIIQSYRKEDDTIWKDFIDEPKTNSELEQNIDVIDKSLLFYKNNDTLVIKTLSAIKNNIVNAENNYSTQMANYPINSSVLLSLINQYKIFSEKTNSKLVWQKNYYASIINNSGNSNEIWDNYVNAENEMENARQKYFVEINEFINKQKLLNK